MGIWGLLVSLHTYPSMYVCVSAFIMALRCICKGRLYNRACCTNLGLRKRSSSGGLSCSWNADSVSTARTYCSTYLFCVWCHGNYMQLVGWQSLLLVTFFVAACIIHRHEAMGKGTSCLTAGYQFLGINRWIVSNIVQCRQGAATKLTYQLNVGRGPLSNAVSQSLLHGRRRHIHGTETISDSFRWKMV